MKRRGLPTALLALSLAAGIANAQSPPISADLVQNVPALSVLPDGLDALPAPLARNGQQILTRFQDGLAAPHCDMQTVNPRWRKQFADTPDRLVDAEDDTLPLFGYVVDQLRQANLPTEFALIPFVESDYQPGLRDARGPVGLWQFIAVTARNHQVPVERGYDGRLSVVDSTRAAMSYLQTLYAMFGGDWQLTAMAYNAGEYRILHALRRGGMSAQDARPSALPGLPPVTRAYVEKLHALACLMEQAGPELTTALDRPVPILRGYALPAETTLADWSTRNALDPARITRLNPALAGKRTGAQVLAPALEQPDMSPGITSSLASADSPASATSTASPAPAVETAPRRHTVRNGETAWSIARRYGLPLKTLLSLNHLDAQSVLRPGMVLRLD